MRIILDDKLSGYGENDLLRDLDLLPAWRREQALRFKHFEGKRNCTRAFLLLWEYLKDKVDLERPQDFPEFVYNEHGKPSLDPSLLISNFSLLTFNFSLSHCKEAVVCITDNQSCGIDVESVGRKPSAPAFRTTCATSSPNIPMPSSPPTTNPRKIIFCRFVQPPPRSPFRGVPL